jgi:hypothetical protein
VYAAAQPAKPPGDVGGYQVGAGHGVPEIEQQLRNAAHPDAADSDKMDMVFLLVHLPFGFSFQVSSFRLSFCRISRLPVSAIALF